MTYENVNTTSLKNAINKIKDIKCTGLETMTNSFSSSDWNSKSMAVVKTAINKLDSEYKALNQKIEKLKSLPDKIDEYKKLESSNNWYESKKSNLRYEYNNTDVEKETKRNNLLSDINWYTNEINKNKNKMATLKNEINSLLEG